MKSNLVRKGFVLAYSSTSLSIAEGSLDRRFQGRADTEAMGVLLTGLLPVACSACFCRAPRTTSAGVWEKLSPGQKCSLQTKAQRQGLCDSSEYHSCDIPGYPPHLALLSLRSGLFLRKEAVTLAVPLAADELEEQLEPQLLLV